MRLVKFRPSKLYRVPIRITLALGVLMISLVVTYTLITASTPTEVGPIGITFFFLVVFVAVISTLTLVKMLILRSTRVSIEGLVGLALIPTIALALGSLRQLSMVDLILIVVFAGLVHFYVRRATAKADSN